MSSVVVTQLMLLSSNLNLREDGGGERMLCICQAYIVPFHSKIK